MSYLCGDIIATGCNVVTGSSALRASTALESPFRTPLPPPVATPSPGSPTSWSQASFPKGDEGHEAETQLSPLKVSHNRYLLTYLQRSASF
jgi:hypothetical protein